MAQSISDINAQRAANIEPRTDPHQEEIMANNYTPLFGTQLTSYEELISTKENQREIEEGVDVQQHMIEEEDAMTIFKETGSQEREN